VSKKSPLSIRRLYLAAGFLAMLFSGVLYAWSILKIPFKESFGWTDSALALNFTLTMCCFCIGIFVGGLICKKAGPGFTLILSSILVGAGFVLTGLLTQNQLILLYITYAFLAGTGIGISYNVLVSTVSAWFPDKKGFCSGCLMMGFGLSTLLIGKAAEALFKSPAIGWSTTYILLGIALAVVLFLAGLILKRPPADLVFPKPKAVKATGKESFEVRDYTTGEMIKSFSYWRAFLFLVLITAVGNSVISFARDLVLSIDKNAEALAVTLVGVLAICNGLGRILTGTIYDALGRRTTMLAANILTIGAAGITLLAVRMSSLPLVIMGLCLTGLSYGSCPTITSAFTSTFYGQKHFPINYSISSSSLIGAAFIAMGASNLVTSTGGYTAPFIMLLILAVCALGLNFSVRKP